MKTYTTHLIFINEDGAERYTCNQAVRPIFKKLMYDPNNVTCKNCLNIFKQRVNNKLTCSYCGTDFGRNGLCFCEEMKHLGVMK